jgi:hypothetical protein
MTQIKALNELLQSDAVTITPAEAGAVLGVHQSYVTDSCRNGSAGFPCFISGNRVKISRIGFLQWGGWLKGGETDGETPGEDHGGLG